VLAQTPAAGQAPATEQTPATPTGLWDRSNLLGEMGGLRPWLGDYGVTFNLQETSEYLNNLSGGAKRGGAYDGLTQFGIVVDTEKALGLPGGTFNVSALQIHGSNLSQRNLLTLQSASGIEADDTTRLWELWYQQSLIGGKVDVKVGQQSLDQEFMVSQFATPFINATVGWPVLPLVDMPAGGPAYPLSSLGVRLRARPSDAWTVMAGVFDGNPAGSDTGDPQQQNRHGTNFNLRGGALFIGEVQYAINQPPANSSVIRRAVLRLSWRRLTSIRSRHGGSYRRTSNMSSVQQAVFRIRVIRHSASVTKRSSGCGPISFSEWTGGVEEGASASNNVLKPLVRRPADAGPDLRMLLQKTRR
jgi:porin